MLSRSPLNTVASPGPPRLTQNNSRNQMHSPSPQMQNGNFGMPPMNNFNNQMPPIGMRGGPQQQQMHPDDMMSGFGGNYGPPVGASGVGMPPHMNQGGPYSPNSGMMNMNPHSNMMSPHGQSSGMMPMYNQQIPPQGSGMSPYPQNVMSPHQQQIPGPPNMSSHGMMMTQGPPNMMPHPQSRVMSPHQQGLPPPGMMHHHGQPPGMMPQHMQQNNIPGMMSGPGPRMMMPQHMHHQQQQQQQFSMYNQGPPMQQNSIVYPANKPLIFNTQNPNAPPIHPCGVCHREVQGDSEEALLCESGCNFWFHRICINMSPDAYILLRNEPFTEWVCDTCMRTKNIPPIKLRS